MTTPSPKSWFRFSLRTLLILVTLPALWLGYQRHWFNQRTAYIDAHHSVVYQGRGGPGRTPGLLWLWEERRIARVVVWIPDSMGEWKFDPYPPPGADRARKLFPEAEILLSSGNPLVDSPMIYRGRWRPRAE